MQANLAALFAAFCFGIVIFPWKEAAGRVEAGGIFLTIGLFYMAYGTVRLWLAPPEHVPRVPVIGLCVLVAAIDLCAVIAYNHAVTRPGSALPVVAAFVSVQPFFSVLAATLVLHEPVTPRQLFFITVTVAGIAGLSLSSRPGP